MSVSISYDDFQTAPSVFTDENGPWLTYESSPAEILCDTLKSSWCHFDSAFYGSASTLDFTWNFTSWWGSNDNRWLGTHRNVTSTVGSDAYVDELNIRPWFSETWIGGSVRHVGTIALGGSPPGFKISIPLAINITYDRSYANVIQYYIKDVGFVITTPTVTPGSTTPISISSPTQSSTVTSESTTSTTQPPPSNGSRSSSKTGAIVGGVIGGVVLCIFCTAIWFLMRRRRKTANPINDFVNKPVNNPVNTAGIGAFVSPTDNMVQRIAPQEPNNRPR
ncbi:hypothetical protein FRC16_006046 [Serendipita sp. 398]|nr:hypothetical protein FRC16_006046 [Serendipita sp. 398]